MSSSKEEFHQVMETNVDDAEIPAPNTSRNQIAMMYLASERRNKELEDQLEKANETNEKMQRRAAAFKSKKQVVQNAIGDILQSFNAVLTNHTEKRKVLFSHNFCITITTRLWITYKESCLVIFLNSTYCFLSIFY